MDLRNNIYIAIHISQRIINVEVSVEISLTLIFKDVEFKLQHIY